MGFAAIDTDQLKSFISQAREIVDYAHELDARDRFDSQVVIDAHDLLGPYLACAEGVGAWTEQRAQEAWEAYEADTPDVSDAKAGATLLVEWLLNSGKDGRELLYLLDSLLVAADAELAIRKK